ncbi:hypothetical protein PROVRETT_08882 [Providencia rettgeri DSM 1131]|nr:hypothetical protein PROVRETT_08882 [Providencia rettgeri DSM 1131]
MAIFSAFNLEHEKKQKTCLIRMKIDHQRSITLGLIISLG